MFSPLKSTCSKCSPQHQTSNIVSSLGPCHPFPSQVSGMASGSSELPQPTWRMAASSLPVVASVVKKCSSSESIWVSAIFWVPPKIIVIVFPIETYSNLIASLFVASQIPVLVTVNMHFVSRIPFISLEFQQLMFGIVTPHYGHPEGPAIVTPNHDLSKYIPINPY